MRVGVSGGLDPPKYPSHISAQGLKRRFLDLHKAFLAVYILYDLNLLLVLINNMLQF